MPPAQNESPNRPTIWIDVEDLFDYFRFNPHPSGIQRVALDIMRALAAAVPNRLRLARRGARPGEIRTVSWPELDALLVAPPEPEPDEEPEDDRSFRARMQRGVLRLPPELRDPLVRARVLQSQVALNGRALLHAIRPPPPRPIRPVPQGEAIVSGDGPARGDLFLSLGAPWSVRGAAAQLVALKSSGVRTALLLHDLIPVRRPEWFPPAQAERFRTWLDASLRHVDDLLTISRFTAGDVAAYAAKRRLPTPTPHVLPPGSSTLHPGGAPSAGLPVAESYVLFVSTLEARKNHALVVQVWHRLMAEVRAGSRDPASVPQLVFAGRIGTGVADLLQQLDNSRWLNGRIRLIREPGDAEVQALYRGCLFTVLPSLFEGWGLPLGESLAAGAPCLAATGTALPEAGGDLCRYFDPEDIGDAHRAIAAWLDTPGALTAARAEIARHYRSRSWDEAAAAIIGLAA